jgi:hypothetical protein
MKGNSINDCDFFYSSSFLSGAAAVIARPASQKTPATPLIRISLERVVQTSSFAHQLYIILIHETSMAPDVYVTVLCASRAGIPFFGNHKPGHLITFRWPDWD